MILEELNVPYEHKFIDFADLKKEPFESINPNGRVPAIEDPNTGISIWESGAILEYLVETYDKRHNISFAAGSKEYYETKQWLHYQMSGQGPAIERYINEIRRVSGVLNRWLENKEYLVGGKYSYVDAAFVPWFNVMAFLWSDKIDIEKDFPHVNSWLTDRIKSRPAIANTFDNKAKAMAAEGKKEICVEKGAYSRRQR
ncbi:unnamed protein product [Penicillium egyptiacum]|uniref:Glutathione S-transferase n=1 Tax=Penicillium egyptiacum TaxID=1303716 RepID=A0A9W4P578_9EURO|nr:unnamed protein product [Penicillium egyptiacum]